MSVVIVIADSVRADMLGGAKARTENFDRLAASGCLFDKAISAAPWTVPSIAALATGTNAHRVGVATWEAPFPAERPNVFSLAAAAGMEVASFPFDESLLLRAVPEARVVGSSQDLEAVLTHLRQRRGKEHLTFVHWFGTHVPYVATGKKMSIVGWKAATDALLAAMRGSEVAREKTKVLYRLAIERFDREVLGGLAKAIDLDKTWLIVTADHGESFGERPETSALRDVFDMHGSALCEEVLRVPLLIRPPGGCRAHRVAGIARTVDILPTLCAAAQLGATPEDIDGLSLAQCLESGMDAPAQDALSAASVRPAELSRRARDGRPPWTLLALTTKTHRLVLDLDSGSRSAFDLTADPGETRDISRRDAADLGHGWALLDFERDRIAMQACAVQDAIKVEERLRCLGYID